MIRRPALVCALTFSLTANAQLRDENLLFGLPRGFHVGFEKGNAAGSIMEMVPDGETVERWTEMVTVQIFHGDATGKVPKYRSNMQSLIRSVCSGAESANVADGEENGYAFAVWLQDCPLNKSSGTPERAFVKAIAGHDSLYVVQRAYRSERSNEQAAAASRFLRDIKVCDTRGDAHPCPAGMADARPAPARSDQ